MAAPRNISIASDFLANVLSGEAFMLCDGAMGSLIQQAGLSCIHEVPDLLNLSHPDAIAALQADYVQAGSDCITTNTFNSNRPKLEGSGYTVAEVYSAAARIARQAGAPLVAGDIGPTGSLLEPLGRMSVEEAYGIFAEQARAAQDAGCDLIFLETFSDLLEAKTALLACLDQTTLPVFVTMTFGQDGRTFMGTTPAIAASTLSAIGASAVGLNCSLGPDELAPLASQMAGYARCRLMVQPNAGLPCVTADGETVYNVGPEEFCSSMADILDAGATIVGGCCGTTPAHITQLRQLINSRNTLPNHRDLYRSSFIVTSGQDMCELSPLDSSVAIVGERINPTGKKQLKDALASGNYDVIISEAVAQIDAGADILDVNVGVPGLDEQRVLAEVCERLQSTVSTPLQLDCTDAAALENACRIYAGRPLINSVNGKAESLAAVLPIAARYGATLVCLTLDENGIAHNAAGRIAIARRIIEAAQAAGVPKEDIAIDCLVMAAATNQDEIPEILDAVRICKEDLGVRTVLGVSNISFGLPHRPVMNAAFLTAALASGLDMPIMNPLEQQSNGAVRAYRVFNGQDAGCHHYVETYATLPEGDNMPVVTDRTDAGQTPQESVSLYDCVITGRADGAARAALELLGTSTPVEIAEGVLAPALDDVGQRYDEGSYFLPQLMASAEAAKAAFGVLGEKLEENAGDTLSSNTLPIIIATVEGDIHDIGKNIVKMLLENYGFVVQDLGRDVAPQVIVDAVVKSGAKLVGLSALMTTTVKAMEQTIELLREQAPDVTIMVGGAVLTEDYASRIGADRYAADAAASIRIAQEVLGS